jgi:predicted aspartyl protease
VGERQPLILVAGRIHGFEPIHCALDTGASHCMLLPEVAARLGVRADDVRQATGADGPVEVRLGLADSVALGDAVAYDVPMIISDELRHIGEKIGHPLEGNLGHSFLGRYRLTVDYPQLSLELATPNEPDDARPARAHFEFQLAHPSKPLVMIPVRVGKRPASFALDTGASITVISPELAQACAIETTEMPSLTGGGGAITATAGVIPELAIATLRIPHVHVAVADFLAMLSRAMGTQVDGILGTNVLRDFRLTIDYPRRRVRLE